ncbi:COR domain-containing protein [Niveispirillum lacus]|uniref:COR domain-containing protein n=1 Tax=Niveispirillum lacus TaxID=1981099 RepID=UPI0013FDFEF1|nr:COR domain-containing protein [Niveispirillum lacus]
MLILGNGRVGKTQITRRLCQSDFTFNQEWDSTHGIRIGQATLPAIEDIPVTLSVWDFGGQDIYHGTHALFLNSPAILALVWDKDAEQRRRHGSPDQWFRDYPLPYWLALARQQGDVNSPIIAVQSKCDTVRAEAAPTIQDPDSVSNLPFAWRPLSLSAKSGYGWSGFTERLQAAVAWMRDPDHVGMPKIGAGRKRVREELLTLRKTQHLLSMGEFEALCQNDGGISSPDALLSWLHADGTVYYRKDLFNDQIVLDQQWALDAIYAVFDRQRGALKAVREMRGRFTREALARLVWQEYSQDEQDLFLSMMVSCGICFKHRMVREIGRDVQEYIAPDLLPDRAMVADDFNRHWKDGDEGEQATLSFPILHGGLIRTILSDIGGGKGSEHALYWNRGILARDGHSNGHFIIEQPEDEAEAEPEPEMGAPNGWRGDIRIRTQGDDAAGLLSRLLTLVHSTIDRIGLKGSELDSSVPWSPRGDHREDDKIPLSLVAMRPWNRNWFVSYAWDNQVFFVDCLCDAAQANGINILRDKNEIKLGDSIHGFMNKLKDGERVFVVLSDKYLRSANCMYELAEIWDRSQKDPDQFLPRICLWTMPDAKIWTATDRATYAVHWREQFNKLNAVVQEHGEDILGPSDRTALRNMRRFSTDVGEILATFADRIQPRTWADILKKGFAD